MIKKLICVSAMMLWSSSAWALDADALRSVYIPPNDTKAQKEVCAAAVTAAYISLARDSGPEISEDVLRQVETYAFYWISLAATANSLYVETYYDQRIEADMAQLYPLGSERWGSYATQCLERLLSMGE